LINNPQHDRHGIVIQVLYDCIDVEVSFILRIKIFKQFGLNYIIIQLLRFKGTAI